jgi:two-component system, NarL family, sensor kinase
MNRKVGQRIQLTIRVRDYGKGMPTHVSVVRGSQGLGVGVAGMRERLRQFGGELTISRAEPGTLVEATIPIFGVGSLLFSS